MTRANPDETVTVELRFYAPFRDAVGEKTVALDLPAGATLGDALARVAERHPEVEGKLLDDEGEVRRGVRALRNGNERAEADDRLDDGDEVSFTTPIHGG
ncbi:MoaD/ThiS family protein [Halorussus salilacus]|uniref:ubiquitin-like small modifier protein 1 n=1 Tax=Halorussus salilacus TaxID=2953750 RepID=UPI00209E5C8D|nr:ubiquitin-like small modifier protein 1 [Halorussus salilacus]USZ68412.1 MoaD/ThiS family protein [Halorussus salilacus]